MTALTNMGDMTSSPFHIPLVVVLVLQFEFEYLKNRKRYIGLKFCTQGLSSDPTCCYISKCL